MAESEKDHKLPEQTKKNTTYIWDKKKLIVGPRDKLTMLEFEQHFQLFPTYTPQIHGNDKAIFRQVFYNAIKKTSDKLF